MSRRAVAKSNGSGPLDAFEEETLPSKAAAELGDDEENEAAVVSTLAD